MRLSLDWLKFTIIGHCIRRHKWLWSALWLYTSVPPPLECVPIFVCEPLDRCYDLAVFVVLRPPCISLAFLCPKEGT
jgi:hypothetical protein